MYRLSYITEANSSDEEEEDEENSEVVRDLNGKTIKDFKNHANIISTYVLTQLPERFRERSGPDLSLRRLMCLPLRWLYRIRLT